MFSEAFVQVVCVADLDSVGQRFGYKLDEVETTLALDGLGIGRAIDSCPESLVEGRKTIGILPRDEVGHLALLVLARPLRFIRWMGMLVRFVPGRDSRHSERGVWEPVVDSWQSPIGKVSFSILRCAKNEASG